MKMKSVTLQCLFILLLHYSAAVPVERFYPFGASAGDQSLLDNDDGTIPTDLSTAFPFFDTNYNTLNVSNNGLILFNSSLPNPLHHNPTSLPLAGYPFVAPFWADIDTTGSRSGTVWWRETTSPTVLNRTREDIQTVFETSVGFQPQFAFIATWERVEYFGSQTDQVNTFQCVLVTDGALSFVIFLYGDIQWTKASGDNPAVAGVNVGDGIRQLNVSESLTEDIININTTTNVGVPGVWIFQLNADINECAVNNGGCNQVCTNTLGSFRCSCNTGYSLNSDGRTCSDNNECSLNTDGCDQVCINTVGSVRCGCNTGYILNADGRTCSDINECALNNGGCDQVCTNTIGSFQCSCNRGYSLNGDGRSCSDVNECALNNGGCDQICDNTVGSFQCSCNRGYNLNLDRMTCSDINECSLNIDGCDQVCINTMGSFQCSCNRGYTLNTDGITCTDVNECALNNGGCEQVCNNSVGSFQCSCNRGYRLDLDQMNCSDINECSLNTDGCDQVCINTVGSFQCSCNRGYVLNADGITCSDVNECALNNGGCEQVCNNSVGSFQCSCNRGYTLNSDGNTCTDVNECAVNNGGCEQVCNNSVGSFQCSCNRGYRLNLDRMNCSDINECSLNTDGCDQVCINTVGSFQCSCNRGYTLSSDGTTCTDVNECVLDNGGCEQVCNNSMGSFQCSCNRGYRLNLDRTNCSDINECSLNTDGCDQVCLNTVGSFQCGCNRGYLLNADGRTCTMIISDCAVNNGGCDQVCTNTSGSVQCGCNTGYTLNVDGRTCSDSNECALNNGGCDQLCNNTVGSFQCGCNNGYSLGPDGVACVDTDECSMGAHDCQQHCNNTNGGFVCSCNVGFQLNPDQNTCSRIMCRKEVIQASGTTYIWPATPSDSTASFTCPNNRGFSVFRNCSTLGIWLPFDEGACGVVNQLLTRLNNSFTNLSTEIYEEAVSTLAQVIEQSENNIIEQTSEVLSTTAEYSTELATFVGDSNVDVNNTVVNNIVQVVSSLLQWEPANVQVESSSRVLQSFEEVVSFYAQQLSMNEKQTFTAPSLVVIAESRNAESLAQEGRLFAISDSGEPVLGSGNQMAQMVSGQVSMQQDIDAISLPQSLFQKLNSNSANIGVFYGFYETATLFPVGNTNTSAPRQLQVCSRVLATTVGQNVTIENLEEPVTVTLRLQDKEGMFTAPASEMCVSWDFDLQDWTPQGCNTSVGTGGIITCHCNHLTNFAVLVETCSIQEDCQTQTTEVPITTTSLPTITQLESLNDSFSNLTAETVEMAVSMLAQVIEGSARNENEQDSAVLNTTASYLTDLATFLNNSNETINSIVVKNVVRVVASLLQWNPQNIVAASSSSAIQSFEVVVYLFAQQLSVNETQNFTAADNSLTVVSELRSVASLSTTGRSFAIGNNEFETNDGDQVMPGQLSPQQDAAISLPASLFQTITDREDVGIFFALYNSSTLFPVDGGRNRNESRRREVGSRVLAATVGPGLDFQNLTENVTIVLRLTTNYSTEPGSEMCVSWNFTLENWTPEGCATNIGKNGIVTCSCNHLTNFAILVNSCIREEDCELPSINSPALTIISYIGMSISIVSLLATIITLLIFKKLREKDISIYHIQLSLSMIFMFIASFALIALSVKNSTDPYGGCVTVSVLVHYFTLVAVMWMAAIALFIFQKVMFVFHKITTKFTVGVSIVCWTTPLVLVLIPLIVDLADAGRDIIVHRPNSTEAQSYCFLFHRGAFWGAFLAPILAIVVFNTVIFICVIVVLVRHTRGTAARKNERVSRKMIIRLMISISGVMFLFGLNWVLTVFAFSITGQILFIIFNTLQGFFIFLFFVVFNKEAVESWKELLSCGRYKSKLLHPSTASSAVMKKSKQANSNGSKGQSPTTETSKSYNYGSDTLTKGNDYEKAPFDSKIDLEANSFNKAPDSKQDQNTDPTESVTRDTHETNIVNNASSQNGNVGTAAETKEKKIVSLKARFRRYTTVKKSKHHVEEVEVDFNSDSGSDAEGNAATEL